MSERLKRLFGKSFQQQLDDIYQIAETTLASWDKIDENDSWPRMEGANMKDMKKYLVDKWTLSRKLAGQTVIKYPTSKPQDFVVNYYGGNFEYTKDHTGYYALNLSTIFQTEWVQIPRKEYDEAQERWYVQNAETTSYETPEPIGDLLGNMHYFWKHSGLYQVRRLNLTEETKFQKLMARVNKLEAEFLDRIL